MDAIQIYNSIREEIIWNHLMMHWLTLIVVVLLFIGVFIVENRRTALSVFLPLLSIAWAAAILRFDFFVHRQAAYLRSLETSISQKGSAFPIWETWKDSLRATPIIIPFTDILLFLVIVLPTLYVVSTSTQEYFLFKNWPGRKVYGFAIIVILLVLLTALPLVPAISRWRF